MRQSVTQPDFFGGEKIIKGKGRPRNSSFQARCFQQLKALNDLYVAGNDATVAELPQYHKEVDLELQKVHMLVKERDEILKKKRDEYAKRGR